MPILIFLFQLCISWIKLEERKLHTPQLGWLGRSEAWQNSTLDSISSRTCRNEELGGTLAADALVTTVTVYPLLASTVPSHAWCDRNTLCPPKKWQVRLKSGSGSKGIKKNFVTRLRIAHSAEIQSWKT